jgi:hypothetical protein
MTADGRPFVRDRNEPDDEAAEWMPDPPRDGDPVYCCGKQIGTFHGDYSRPDEWYIETVPSAEMPPKLAAKALRELVESRRANELPEPA